MPGSSVGKITVLTSLAVLLCFRVDTVTASTQKKAAKSEAGAIIEELVITAQAMSLLTEMRKDTAELLSVAGAAMDPLAATLSLPGVTFASDTSSEPAVRGSAPDDNGYYIDFVPARYVFHVLGNSIFNHNLIHSFDLHPAAFGSQYSDATGAIIDVKLRDPRNTSFTTTIDASFLGAGVLLESGLGKHHAFYVSFRRSLIDKFINDEDKKDRDSGVRVEQIPISEDYQFKYRWEVDAQNRLTLLAAGASDWLEATFRNDADLVRRDPDFAGLASVTTSFDSQGMSWDHLSDNANHGVKISLTSSSERDDVYYGTGQFMETETKRNTLRAQWDYDSGGAHHFMAGGWIENTDFELNLNAKIPACSSLDAACPTIDAPLIRIDDTFSMNSRVLFAEDRWRLTPALTLRTGLHYLYDEYMDKSAVDPRLRLEWQASDAWSFHIAYGHYSQLPKAEELAPLMGNPDLEIIEAVHHVVGMERKFGNEWSWSVELYHKQLENLPLSLKPETDPDHLDRYASDATGQAYGMELLIKKELTDKFYGWLALSLSKTERRDERTGATWRFDYDKPIILNWVMNYQATNRWLFGIKWSVQSGNLYTPVIETRSHPSNPDVEQLIYGEPNSERLPMYHRLDFRAEYTKRTNYGMWSAFLDLLNVYDADNVQAVSSTPDTINGDVRLRSSDGLGFFPSIGFKLQF